MKLIGVFLILLSVTGMEQGISLHLVGTLLLGLLFTGKQLVDYWLNTGLNYKH